jgi:hypothetical protein
MEKGNSDYEYIDKIPILIGVKKVSCPFCRQEYVGGMLIDYTGQKECEFICTNCHRKNYLHIDEKMLARYLKKAKVKTIEEEKEKMKKEIGWDKPLYYPGYLWENYERWILPYQKYPNEQKEILHKYDEEQRIKADYNRLLIAFYDFGNLKDSISLHYRDGQPYLLDNENILHYVDNILCIIRYHIKPWGKLRAFIGMDPPLEKLYIFSPPLGKGKLYITNHRLIYLHDIRKGYMHPGGWSGFPDHRTHASYVRYYIGRMDGFSIPKKCIIAYSEKTRKKLIYFQTEDTDRYELLIFPKKRVYELKKYL